MGASAKCLMVYNVLCLNKKATNHLVELSGKIENHKVSSKICLLPFVGLTEVKMIEGLNITNSATPLHLIKKNH